ncbi:hypothetical protein FJT64_011896 [Amphibalanus amphitrite]|uniref:Saposin B-type domain-containing protein n=1 Tax=Amphibalanus amphitrite TaxID=1232801 RepID=A0A6A4VF45_AMPAM|nr:hypothetical protein FJT64_011896 [Amphibalanus amphitrite]
MRRTLLCICVVGLLAPALADTEAAKAAAPQPLAQALAQARDGSSHGSHGSAHSVGGSYSTSGGGSYSAPAQPSGGYDAPASSHQSGGGGGLLGLLGAVLVPLLVLGGALLLALVIGSLVVAGTGRSADPMAAWKADLERLVDDYLTMLEDERCVQRIFCEVGLRAEPYRFPGKQLVASLVEQFAPEMVQENASILSKASTGIYDKQQCKKMFACKSRLGDQDY